MTAIVRQFTSLAHQEILEEVACPLCGAHDDSPAMVARDRLFGRPGAYPLVRCDACAMLYVNPRPTPDALGAHYPDDYFAYALPTDMPKAFRPLLQWLTRGISLQRIRYLEKAMGRIPSDASIVDVGCGINSLLWWIRRLRGAEGIGVDFKQEVVDWVRAELGMRVERGTLKEVAFEPASVDVVTMTEYLEHEPNPRDVLDEARRVLKPGGHLAIEIPDPTGWPARTFGSAWWNLDVPRHLVFFEPSTLERMLDQCGFDLVRVQRFGLPFYVGTSLYQALGLRYSPRYHGLFLLLSGLLGAPFAPFTPLVPEFLFAVARAR
ncbi:MAG: class I SAM-dependent methyltransferase [Myxococcota bacterium]